MHADFRKPISIFAVLTLTGLASACGSAKFSGSGGHQAASNATPPGTDGAEQNQAQNDEAAHDGSNATPLTDDPCPVVPQNTLILDFKSGWWAGDGGVFFQRLLQGLVDPCVGAVTFEYHHITSNGNTMEVIPGSGGISKAPEDLEHAVLHADWSAYTQVWVLSGSHGDSEDLRTDGTLFSGLMDKLKSVNVPIMIGSGNGNITHANALLSLLGSATHFATTLPEGPVVDASGTFGVLSQLTAGVQLQAHPLFQRGVQSIADDVSTTSVGVLFKKTVAMHSDYLAVGDDFTVESQNTAGAPVIAVSTGRGARPVVLDAGLQRFYAIATNSGDQTKTYLQNILLFLAKH